MEIKNLDEANQKIRASADKQLAQGTTFDMSIIRRRIVAAIESPDTNRAFQITMLGCALSDILLYFRLLDADPVSALNDIDAAGADVRRVLEKFTDK